MPSVASTRTFVPKPARPNWTRVHLICFALALCDLAAVGSGLWLSRHTQKQFENSIASVEGARFLYDRAATLPKSAAGLLQAGYQLEYHRDASAAEALLAANASEFRATASEERFVESQANQFGQSTRAIGHEAPGAARKYAELLRVPVSVMDSYETAESRIRSLGDTAVAQMEKAINDIRGGRMESSSAALGRAIAASSEIQSSIAGQSQVADSYAHLIVRQGQQSFASSSAVQYAIGCFILAMVGLVMAYAHMVGWLLMTKYEELDKAHSDADEAGALLNAMNEDVIRLNSELAANLRQLASAQSEVVRKRNYEQLGQLTARVAHELRNPLGAVRTSAYLLERRLADKNLGVENQLKRIANGVSRCDAFVSQLLQLSNHKELVLEETEIDGWLLTLLTELSQDLPGALTVDFDPGLAGQAVAIDSEAMARAIAHLVKNAAEALRQRPENGRILISTTLRQGRVEVMIADNGPGIPSEHRDKVLQPLFTTKNFGTGLGLPAALAVMADHRGGLELCHPVEGGTAVVLWLPISAPARAAA